MTGRRVVMGATFEFSNGPTLKSVFLLLSKEAPMSRILYVIACGALAVMVLGDPAQAQQPPFATTKVEGTNNVYIFRYGNRQAVFVVTSAGVIATDPIGYGQLQAVTTYVDEIRKVTNQPIR